MSDSSEFVELEATSGIAFAVGIWFYKQLQIDKCLDGGGAWQYELSACQGAKLDE